MDTHKYKRKKKKAMIQCFLIYLFIYIRTFHSDKNTSGVYYTESEH